MECKIGDGYRVTIPQAIRDSIDGFKMGLFGEIHYDREANQIIIDLSNSGVKAKEIVDAVKETSTKSHKKEISNKSTYKIEANYMDAPKLYSNSFSECGLVVKTKRKYVNNFCERCKGQLALEYEDRIDVHCSYLKNRCKDVLDGVKESDLVNKSKCIEEVAQQESKQKLKENLNANKDLKIKLSQTIKKATKEIDNQIEKLQTNKDSNKHSTIGNDNTIIVPIRKGRKLLVCSDCGEMKTSGFMLDDKFLCGKCTKKDFIQYMKERRGR